MTRFVVGDDRSRSTLFPERLDDYLADIPKGTLRGSPPNPEDDVTTLKVSFYLVAKKSLDNDMIAGFTQALTSARRDLVGEFPILAQVKAPDTDAGAYLPVHPGAAEFYNGTQQVCVPKTLNADVVVVKSTEDRT